MNYRKVLLLSMGYIPIKVLSWRKAANLVIGREKAHVVEDYKEKRFQSFDAAVIRLVVKSPNPFAVFERQKFTKRNVFLRDEYKCQYCDLRLVGKELTIDHVIPRYHGGKTSYMNCVTACKECNSKKGNSHLFEISMKLAKPIRKPKVNDLFNSTFIPDEWGTYLGS